MRKHRKSQSQAESSKSGKGFDLNNVVSIASTSTALANTGERTTTFTLAPLNTNLNRNLDKSNPTLFNNGEKSSYDTSLDMALTYIDKAQTADIIASGRTLKKIIMLPLSAGDVVLACHRIGDSFYFDEPELPPQNVHEKLPQELSMIPRAVFADEPSRAYVPKYPSLSIMEDLIWRNDSPHVSGQEVVVKDGGWECSNSVKEFVHPQRFSSLSYKVEPEDHSGPAYLWNFANLNCLVDINLPIFGGNQYPSVSIRAKETNEEFTVLAGTDMFLDHLMCHLDATIVVNHNDNIVEGYDVYTPDNLLPYLSENQFNPLKLKELTSDILSFLKERNMIQGHTYWLVKNDGVTKLYDLTAENPDHYCDPGLNRFVYPVSTMLIKLAHKLMQETQDYRSKDVTDVCYTLLNSANDLMQNDALIGVKACIEYLLSSLYLTHGSQGSIDEIKEREQKSKLLRLESLLKTKEKMKFCATAAFERTREKQSHKTKQPKTLNAGEVPDLISIDMSLLGIADYFKHITSNGPSDQFWQEAIDHAVKALRACKSYTLFRTSQPHLRICRIPYWPDGIDEFRAQKASQCSDLSDLRHATLVRALIAYGFLAKRATIRGNAESTFIYSRMGMKICDVIMKNSPVDIHSSYSKLFITFNTSYLLYSFSQMRKSGPITMHELDERGSFFDQQILNLCGYTELNHTKEDYSDFYSFERNLILPNDWNDFAVRVKDRITSITRNGSLSYKDLEGPLVKALIPNYDEFICDPAMILLNFGSELYEQAKPMVAKILEVYSDKNTMELANILQIRDFFREAARILENSKDPRALKIRGTCKINSAVTLTGSHLYMRKGPVDTNLMASRINEIVELFQEGIKLLDQHHRIVTDQNLLSDYYSIIVMAVSRITGFADYTIEHLFEEHNASAERYLIISKSYLDKLLATGSLPIEVLRKSLLERCRLSILWVLFTSIKITAIKKWRETESNKKLSKSFEEQLQSAVSNLIDLNTYGSQYFGPDFPKTIYKQLSFDKFLSATLLKLMDRTLCVHYGIMSLHLTKLLNFLVSFGWISDEDTNSTMSDYQRIYDHLLKKHETTHVGRTCKSCVILKTMAKICEEQIEQPDSSPQKTTQRLLKIIDRPNTLLDL